MPNLTSISVARATITDCGKARDALVLLDADGVEIAHSKPTEAALTGLTELVETFNSLRDRVDALCERQGG